MKRHLQHMKTLSHFITITRISNLTQSVNLGESYADCKSKYIDMLYSQAEEAVRMDNYEKANQLIRKNLCSRQKQSAGRIPRNDV